MTNSIVYGPVPSRRLGRSLGINNIPPKRCSYSCIYCQLGPTKVTQIHRESFYKPIELARRVENKLKHVREQGESIDYLTFVCDGEPTLDINLGRDINLLQALNTKIAVITNASLCWHEDIKQDLQELDLVCMKVDSVTSNIWHNINRPHKNLELDIILNGMLRFAESFQGELTTETMLIRGVNDDPGEINNIASFLSELKPAKAYLAIPIRPPAELIEPATEQALNIAYQILSKQVGNVEYLIGEEGNAFGSGGDAIDELLSITAVHPMREEAVAKILERVDSNWEIVQGLINNGQLVELEYNGKKFYSRKYT